MATRRYKVEWDLDYGMRATTYATIEAVNREVHRRLSAQGHLNGSAAVWDDKAKTWTTFRLVPGGRTLGGGRMNPVMHRTAGA